jgi:cytochrome c-type biogenesis protein CcmH/NrfG
MSNEGMLGIFEFGFSIFDWFRARRQARVVAAWIIVPALLVLQGCNRAGKKEEKALRTELRKAIDQQDYGRAVELARRHLKLRPHDNGTWDRLIRAQFGLQDLAGVSQTLDDWRNTVPEPSL